MKTWNGDDITRQVRALLAKRLHRVGDGLVELARSKCPVKSGNLRDSIEYKLDEAELKLYVGAGDYKANWIERGTHENAPEPFLRPALDEAARVLKREL